MNIFAKVIGVLAGAHLVNWIFAKGTIWVVLRLFNTDWSNDFWPVYVGTLLISCLFKSVYIKN